jgi:acetyl esterase/lipase
MTSRYARAGSFVAVLAAAVDLLAQPTSAQEIEVRRNVVYAEATGMSLLADVYLPAGRGPYPGVLVVHGGAWTFGNKSHLAFAARQLAQEGFVAMAINYRLAPQFKFPAQLEDCQAAVSWMQAHADEYKIDGSRLAGYGYSAGGHLVALLAAGDQAPSGTPVDASAAKAKPLKAVVAGGAPCDFCSMPPEQRTLAHWLGGTRQECPDVYRQASPLAYVSADDPPMFFFHGEQDNLVPKSNPVTMTKALAAAGVEAHLHVVTGKGHGGAMFDQPALEASIDFLMRHLDQPRQGE